MDSGPRPAITFASGRYVVERVLPGGNQKRVYLVRDSLLDRECAFAIVSRTGFDEQELERMKREAQSMARLGSHPNLVTLFDFGDEGGLPYFVSEYVSGGDVRAELRRAGGKLPIDRAIDIAEGTAEALQHVHEHGLVHRDVKPSNILIDSRGRAKLADFGLVLSTEDARLTLNDSLMGTAAYMAPEQALGRPPDARSDLYALGATIYEMVAGRPPFVGDDVLAVISQAINTPPVAPSWHNPEVPRALDALIMRLLAKAPEDRALAAADVVRQLQELRAGPSDVAPTEPIPFAALEGLAWGRFVGRNKELSRLRGALDRATQGEGSIIMLAGEPGVGKSRLAEEFAVYARVRGAQVLSGRCYPGESAVPYGPFVDALRQYAATQTDAELREVMGAGASEIALLLPELNQRLGGIPASPPLEGEAERFRLFESVTRMIQAAALRAPVVFLFDDLHWSDTPSLLLLQYAGRRIARAPVVLVGAYRDTDLDKTHALSGILAEFRRDDAYERILLRGLPEDEVLALLAAVDAGVSESDRGRLAHALYEQTEGNPLFIREVLSHLVEEGKIFRENGEWQSSVTDLLDGGIPEGLREVIGLRLSRLSDECNDVLTTVSVMVGGFSWNELCAVYGDGAEDVNLLDRVEEALGAQLLFERRVQRDVVYEFTHALIRTTLSDQLSTPRRLMLHRRIGEALEALHGADQDAQLARLAHHFYEAARAGDTERAISYSVRAGHHALALLAFEEAAGHYRRALELYELQGESDEPERCEVLLKLGEAQARAGDSRRRETFLEAAESARVRGDAIQLSRAALGFGFGEDDFIGEDENLLALLRESAAALPETASIERARVLARLATATLSAADDAGAQELSAQAVQTARAAGDPTTLVIALNARREATFSPDELRERLAIGEEAVKMAVDIPDKVAAWYCHDWLLSDLLELGDLEGVDRELRALSEIAATLRQPLWAALTIVAHTMRDMFAGNFAEAERRIGETAEAARRLDAPSLQFYSQWQLFCLRREQGRLAEMEDFVRTWAPDSSNLGRYLRFAGLRCAELDQRDGARSAFGLAAMDDFAAFSFDNTWIHTLALASEVCVYLGDQPRATVLYDKLLPYEERNVVGGDVVCLGAVARYLGLLAGLLGRTDDAARHFQTALRMHERMGARPYIARTQCDYGALLANTPDRERGRDLLAAGASLARELGMRALAARADRARR